MEPPFDPCLVLLLSNFLILVVGFAVLRAARHRPKTVSILIGVAVVAGLGAIGYTGFVADADPGAVGCFAVGLALLIPGCPAWLLVSAREQAGTNVGWWGVGDWLKLLLGYLCDPFWKRQPSDRAREVAEAVKVLFAYLATCWLFALVLGILAHLTNPAGSFR